MQQWGNVHDSGGNVRDSTSGGNVFNSGEIEYALRNVRLKIVSGGNVRDSTSGGNVFNSGEIEYAFTTLHKSRLRIHGITCQKAIRI